MPVKSESLTKLSFSPLMSILLLAVLIKFSKAVILILALTPLLKSTYSLLLAAKFISSIKSLANSGTCMFEPLTSDS